MKANPKILTQTLLILALVATTACGTSKSNNVTNQSSNGGVVIDSVKPLASCHRLNDSNFSMNIASVKAANGDVNRDWIKVKFQYLSSDITQAGQYLRFYKWRVMNNASQLDSTPLEFNSYALAGGQTNSAAMNGVFATDVNSQNGYYIKLNDDLQYPYQVLKVVAYKTDGSVLAQANVLIPQFLANPEDYKYNPDGSQRVELLQTYHPLYGQSMAGKTSADILSILDQHCF